MKETNKDARGFIAQEYENVFPEQVSNVEPNHYEREILGLSTVKSLQIDLFPYLVKAIQEQNATIQQQAEQITQLMSRLAAAGIA